MIESIYLTPSHTYVILMWQTDTVLRLEVFLITKFSYCFVREFLVLYVWLCAVYLFDWTLIFSYALVYLMNHAIFECRTGLLTFPQVTEQGENHQAFILNALHFQGMKHPKAKWYSESCSKLKIPHFLKLFSIVIVCIKTGEKITSQGDIWQACIIL